MKDEKKRKKKRGQSKVDTGGRKVKTGSAKSITQALVRVAFAGESHVVDVDKLCRVAIGAEVAIGDRAVKALVEFGHLRARAMAHQTAIEASYRSFKANVKKGLLAQDPKVAEWKVDTVVEASEEYTELMEKRADALQAVETLNAVYDAIWHTAAMAKAMIARGSSPYEGHDARDRATIDTGFVMDQDDD